jgi:hypothetical protein
MSRASAKVITVVAIQLLLSGCAREQAESQTIHPDRGAEAHLARVESIEAALAEEKKKVEGLQELTQAQQARIMRLENALGAALYREPEQSGAISQPVRAEPSRVTQGTAMSSIQPRDETPPRSRSPVVIGASGGDPDIAAFCRNKWPGDFRMQKYCLDQQTEAKAKLAKGAPPGIPVGVFNDVRKGCAAKWPDDLRMRVYCEDQQTEAFRSLQ